jgi:hypothetical protein
VTVESVPSGARVLVDGREAGVTPLETTLDSGRYTLVLEHPQYRRFETPITVKSGEPLRIGPIELGLPDGTLMVRTEPAGADVSVRRYRGRSPEPDTGARRASRTGRRPWAMPQSRVPVGRFR